MEFIAKDRLETILAGPSYPPCSSLVGEDSFGSRHDHQGCGVRPGSWNMIRPLGAGDPDIRHFHGSHGASSDPIAEITW